MGEGTEGRKLRRAYKAKARKYQDDLLKVSQLSCKFFKDPEKAKRWLYQETAELNGNSPLEYVLLGRGKEVIALLEKAYDSV